MSIKKVVNYIKTTIGNYFSPVVSAKQDILGAGFFPNSNVLFVAYIEDKTIIVKLGTHVCSTWQSSINHTTKHGDTMAADVAKSLFLTHCSATIPHGVKW